MITTVICKGKKLKIITQKYEVGLYIAIYFPDNPIPDQMGFQVEELQFHNDVRNGKFLKGKVRVIPEESSVII
jgi:hypothetical protein